MISETTESIKKALQWLSNGGEVVAMLSGMTFPIRNKGEIDTICGIDEAAPEVGDVVYVRSHEKFFVRAPNEYFV